MQTSQIKTIISATGLMLLGALGMHAQSIIAPPRSPNAHQMAANTRRPSPKPTVMPANEMYVKGRDATKVLLSDNPELCEELEAKIMQAIKEK